MSLEEEVKNKLLALDPDEIIELLNLDSESLVDLLESNEMVNYEYVAEYLSIPLPSDFYTTTEDDFEDDET